MSRFDLIAGNPGPCAVAMWQAGSPAGTCGREAYGEQFSDWFLPPRYQCPNRPPLAMGYCCDQHGGPGAMSTRFMRDGNAWMAFGPDFENLQESVVGFGATQVEAAESYMKAVAAPVDGRREAETALAGSGRRPTSAVTAKPAGAPSPSSPSNPPQEESPT